MTLFRISTLMVLLGLCSFAMPAYSAENIIFADKNSIQNNALKDLPHNYEFSKVAVIDLNNDSIDEYILASDGNDNVQIFEILAHNNSDFTPLGVIKAQKLMIAYSSNHGVRSLLGFYDADNDFEYDVYLWDAKNSHYARKQDIQHKEAQQ